MASNKDLLKFLFGESVELESDESDRLELDLAENLDKLFEVAAAAEIGELEAKKTPLAKALSEFGISDADLQLDTDGFVLATDNHQKYVDALTVLGTADAMHKLAEMGWVVTKPGDDAMTNEPPNFRIRFLEITTVDNYDREPKAGTYDTANREEVIKKAQKFATTPMDRDDDDLNPVETDIEGSDQDRKGIGKEQDGKQPEGTPKGTEKKAKTADVGEALGNLDEFTGTGSMGASISQHQPFIGPGIRTKGSGGKFGGKFKMPGQWTVQQPVVNKQLKRKVRSESDDPNDQKAEAFLEDLPPSGDIPKGTFGNPGGREPESEEDAQQAYNDMQEELGSGECAVFDDSHAIRPTTVRFLGKELGRVGEGLEFETQEDALAAVAAAMDQQKFWPNIYHVNDHGNVSLWDQNGNEVRSWV